jgi:dihydroneopterin aldolase
VTDRIFLRGIVLFGRHGLIPEEAVLGQRFEVDLDCFLDLSAAGRADRIGATLDYAAVYETVRHTVETERFGLLEALAERIADRLFGEFPPLSKVRVEVRKPGAPIQGTFDTVGVEIMRTREARP